MYMPDLSDHEDDDVERDLVRLAVGWLERGQPYSTGAVSGAFLDALFAACATSRLRRRRGFHPCDLCDPPRGDGPTLAGHRGRSLELGDGELEVIGLDGVRYAAPTLIFHYVADHGYAPPRVFIDAILRGELVEEEPCLVILELEELEAELARALALHLAQAHGMPPAYAARLELRVAVGLLGGAPVRVLRVAGESLRSPWDGTLASALAIVAEHGRTRALSFDEHGARWRPRST